jgi:hypothetical protein
MEAGCSNIIAPFIILEETGVCARARACVRKNMKFDFY